MKKHVLVYRALPSAALALLKTWFDVSVADANDAQAAFARALPLAHGLIGNRLKMTPALLNCAPHLEAIATVSAGYDDFDVDDLTRRRILLCNTPDEVTQTTADLVFALLICAARRIAELDQFVRRGDWRTPSGPAQFGVDVHHKTLGIVGLGRIGSALARRAALGFGMQVLYSNRSHNHDAEYHYGAHWCVLPELLAQSDFVCVLVPLSAATSKLIGAAQFALMKPSAIFVNAARGRVVDETALVEALRMRQIRGAALDVFEREPLPADSPLIALPNVVLAPHIGSATRETREAMACRAATNLVEALLGTLPKTSVNPQARSG